MILVCLGRCLIQGTWLGLNELIGGLPSMIRCLKKPFTLPTGRKLGLSLGGNQPGCTVIMASSH